MSKSVATAATVSAARRVQVVLVGMLMTLLAAISLSAWAQPGPPGQGERGPGMRWPGDGDRAPGAGWTHHGAFHGGRDGGFDFRGSAEHIGRMVDHMLDGLGASDAQRSQIKQIAGAAAADLKAQAEAGRALRQRAMQAFTAPDIDAAAVEQLRQQMVQQQDQISRRITQAMLDAARVLTPEQRARLGERIRDRQARMEDRIKRMQERTQRMEPSPPAPMPRQ